jgi:hypothetical protein
MRSDTIKTPRLECGCRVRDVKTMWTLGLPSDAKLNPKQVLR